MAGPEGGAAPDATAILLGAAAAADAELVPANFLFNARYSGASARSSNNVHVQNHRARNVTVDALWVI